MKEKIDNNMIRTKRWISIFYFFLFVTIIVQIFFGSKFEPEKVDEYLSLACYFILISITSYAIRKNKSNSLIESKAEQILKIEKEFIKSIPIYLLQIILVNLLKVKSVNQQEIESSFNLNIPWLLWSIIVAIVIAPAMEETLFRYIPSKFIRNEKIYIIVTTVLFASMHLLGTEKPLIPFIQYLPSAFWYSYRYIKTKDLDISI